MTRFVLTTGFMIILVTPNCNAQTDLQSFNSYGFQKATPDWVFLAPMDPPTRPYNPNPLEERKVFNYGKDDFNARWDKPIPLEQHESEFDADYLQRKSWR